MKRVLSILLIAVLFLLSGCTQTEYDESNVRYFPVMSEPVFFSSAEELADASDCVYEGIVADISFVAEYDERLFWMITVYTIIVTDQYKGNAGLVEYLAAPGGIPGYKVAEQVQALHIAGDEDPVTILIDEKVPALEVGETYIFFAGEPLEDFPYEGCRGIESLMQFAVNDDTRLTTKEEVYEYFGVDPVARTVLRVGLGIVIVAAVATVAVLLIRKKKKKKAEETRSAEIPEDE